MAWLPVVAATAATLGIGFGLIAWAAGPSFENGPFHEAAERLLRSTEDTRGAQSSHEASIRVHTSTRVASAIDSTNPITRNSAVRVVAHESGAFRVEQVAHLWTHVRGHWRYVNDPQGGEYFAAASETIANDFAGDCDDFAIVVAAMVSAVGGRARIVMMDGPDGGHAYAEACIPDPPEEVARRLAQYYRQTGDRRLGQQRVDLVHFRSSVDCPVWLNLDWNAGVPGGSYMPEAWAVAIYPNRETETVAPARLNDGDPAEERRLVASPPGN